MEFCLDKQVFFATAYRQNNSLILCKKSSSSIPISRLNSAILQPSIVTLLARRGYHCVFLTTNARKDWTIPGVQRLLYKPVEQKGKPGVFSNLRVAESHAEAAVQACVELKKKGFMPDVVYGASGWGGTWLVRDVFPKARLAGYFEWFYDADSADVRFGNREEPGLQNRINLRLRNTVIVNDLLSCDLCITPSQWQKSQFPPALQDKLSVLHDGIDTGYFCPGNGPMGFAGLPLQGDEEIITYATRGMEPYRGFPQFMQALALVLAERPQAHAVIAGEDRICYGSPRPDGTSWKEYMLSQVALPMDRVHFTGSLPYAQYRQLLRSSTGHVYLTRPFVLSWSLLEAMACGCLVVASDTGPVQEVLRHGYNGLLCDFFSPRAIARSVLQALEEQEQLKPLRDAARNTIVSRYELTTLLPQLERMLAGEL